MIEHIKISDEHLRSKIRTGEIGLGGNRKLKIYGLLRCKSGKRMKKSNRVFFNDEKEALLLGYRPCGNCMKNAYKNWKDGFVQ